MTCFHGIFWLTFIGYRWLVLPSVSWLCPYTIKEINYYNKAKTKDQQTNVRNQRIHIDFVICGLSLSLVHPPDLLPPCLTLQYYPLPSPLSLTWLVTQQSFPLKNG